MHTIQAIIVILTQFCGIQSYPDLCPQFCQTCLKETLVCNTPGRNNLPDKVSSTVEKLTVTNQNFYVSKLSLDNFTQFAPPHISLKQLIIRFCNVKLIESRTFSSLTKLESLDLSNNLNLSISSDAFNGLKLRTLIINNIENLRLQEYAFRGLEVTSLSLTNSGLESLDYNSLHPLSRSLSKVFLQGNRLTTLEPRMYLIFQSLVGLDLSGNPFHCDCSLKWLSKLYEKVALNPNFNDNKFQSASQLIPICSSPYHLVNKKITTINELEVPCDSPHISEVDLKLNDINKPELVCTGYQKAWQAPIRITWLNSSGVESILSTENFINRTFVSKPIFLQFSNDIGNYKCIINNVIGETSATVKINWNNIAQNIGDLKKFGRNNYNNNSWKPGDDNDQVTSRSWKSVFFERRFTLLEIIAAITGTILFTGLLFILIHKFILMNCISVKKKGLDKTSQKSNLATLSMTASCDPPIYSNSQTYDQPGFPYGGGSNLYLSSAANSQHQFLDFKTQRKIYRKL